MNIKTVLQTEMKS